MNLSGNRTKMYMTSHWKRRALFKFQPQCLVGFLTSLHEMYTFYSRRNQRRKSSSFYDISELSMLQGRAAPLQGIVLNPDAYCCSPGESWFLRKLQGGEAQRKPVAHTAKTAGIKVACFVNPEIWIVYMLGSQRSSKIKFLF